MELEEFAVRAAEGVKVRLLEDGREPEIRTEKVLKNNGIELWGMSVGDGKGRLSPMLYLEPFYRDYMGGMSLDDVVSGITALYYSRAGETQIDRSDVMDETSVSEKIIVRLINYSQNRKLLEKAVHVCFKDMAVVFYRIIKRFDDGIATAIVTKQDAKRWGFDVDALYRQALRNTERMYSCEISDMYGYLRARYTNLPVDGGAKPGAQMELYVATNSSNSYGAAVILYEGVLDRCAALAGDDIFLLPSSVHEMLFVKAHGGIDERSLMQIVGDANRSVVPAEDYLSDSVYLYKRDSGELLVV